MRTFVDRLEERTQAFAVEAIRLCSRIERAPGMANVARQLSKAAGSVGANHRAVRRARSTREFAAKLQVVYEESDESVFWLEVLERIAPGLDHASRPLLAEAKELRAIFARAKATTRERT